MLIDWGSVYQEQGMADSSTMEILQYPTAVVKQPAKQEAPGAKHSWSDWRDSKYHRGFPWDRLSTIH
jgi:hypothetical protein